jgi:hypothetical protein
MTNIELVTKIAHHIFNCGHEPNDKVQRLEFKGGQYPDNETNLGGLCLDALINVIEQCLDDLKGDL